MRPFSGLSLSAPARRILEPDVPREDPPGAPLAQPAFDWIWGEDAADPKDTATIQVNHCTIRRLQASRKSPPEQTLLEQHPRREQLRRLQPLTQPPQKPQQTQ